MGYWFGTLIYGLVWFVMTGGILATGQKGQNGLKHLMCGTAVFCCWWSIMYWAQIHPIINPVLQSHS